MSDKFTCTWHADGRVLESVLTGMWTGEDVTAYYSRMRALVVEYAGEGPMRLLTDLRKYPVQQPGTADVHRAMLPRIKSHQAITAVAWVTGGLIASMQAKRSLGESASSIAVFHDRDEAWAYLAAA